MLQLLVISSSQDLQTLSPCSPLPAVAPELDIADCASACVRQAFSDEDKYNLATKKSEFRPPYAYKKLAGEECGTQRHFQFDWLEQFCWLVFKTKENGEYCLPCAFFWLWSRWNWSRHTCPSIYDQLYQGQRNHHDHKPSRKNGSCQAWRRHGNHGWKTRGCSNLFGYRSCSASDLQPTQAWSHYRDNLALRPSEHGMEKAPW